MCVQVWRVSIRSPKKNGSVTLLDFRKIYNRFMAYSFHVEHMAEAFEERTWSHYRVQEDQLLGKTVNTKE